MQLENAGTIIMMITEVPPPKEQLSTSYVAIYIDIYDYEEILFRKSDASIKTNYYCKTFIIKLLTCIYHDMVKSVFKGHCDEGTLSQNRTISS